MFIPFHIVYEHIFLSFILLHRILIGMKYHSGCQETSNRCYQTPAMREASCYQTASSTVDLFGNSMMSGGFAPCRCWEQRHAALGRAADAGADKVQVSRGVE